MNPNKGLTAIKIPNTIKKRKIFRKNTALATPMTQNQTSASFPTIPVQKCGPGRKKSNKNDIERKFECLIADK
ncbi:MAG TPA: hypothetical protein VLA71_19770 [Algoriphagus sp.]|nr:hypothetical protein [Algoriphagus sp.]